MTPNQRQITLGTFKIVDGQWHKICTGPAHESPQYLPATEKYFYVRKSEDRAGELVSRCRLCMNWAKIKSPGSERGWLPVRDVLPFYVEAVNRVGLAELSRRTGLNSTTILSVLLKRSKYVQRAKFKLVLLELISMRRKGEHHLTNGARWRNEQRNNRGSQTCSECGTPASNFTEGCATCWERQYRREYRSAIKVSPES